MIALVQATPRSDVHRHHRVSLVAEVLLDDVKDCRILLDVRV